MAHSSWIALGLLALFFVFITAKGELGQYLSTVFGPFPTGGSSGSQGGAAGALGSATGAIGGAANLAGSVTNLLSAGQALAGGSAGGGTGGLY